MFKFDWSLGLTKLSSCDGSSGIGGGSISSDNKGIQTLQGKKHRTLPSYTIPIPSRQCIWPRHLTGCANFSNISSLFTMCVLIDYARTVYKSQGGIICQNYDYISSISPVDLFKSKTGDVGQTFQLKKIIK